MTNIGADASTIAGRGVIALQNGTATPGRIQGRAVPALSQNRSSVAPDAAAGVSHASAATQGPAVPQAAGPSLSLQERQEIRAQLRAAIPCKYGEVKAFGHKHGFDAKYLYNMMRGRARITPRLISVLNSLR